MKTKLMVKSHGQVDFFIEYGGTKYQVESMRVVE